MSARQNCKYRGHNRLARWLALMSFLLVLIGTARSAHAARVPAPMCAPDAQSMPAPLQRTATSDAEIKRGGCLTVLGPSWDVLPNRSDLPINWHQFVGDPLWLGQLCVRAPKGVASSTVEFQSIQEERPGHGVGVFRPPRSMARSEHDLHIDHQN